MTNGEKIEEIFPNLEISPYPYSPSVDIYVGGIMMMRVDRNWWNAEYKELTIEHEQKIDKLAMMYEIYMAGVNMAGEYQGCWVRFEEIEKIVDKYVR